MRMIKREIPVIGISTEIDIPGRISVKRKYVDAVLQAGGIPFILPFTDNVQILQSVISIIGECRLLILNLVEHYIRICLLNIPRKLIIGHRMRL